MTTMRYPLPEVVAYTSLLNELEELDNNVPGSLPKQIQFYNLIVEILEDPKIPKFPKDGDAALFNDYVVKIYERRGEELGIKDLDLE